MPVNPSPRSFVIVAALGASACHRSAAPALVTDAAAAPRAAVDASQPAHGEALASAQHAAHAYGRAGDRVLVTRRGARLTVATNADAAGHRPLRGSVVDVRLDGRDAPDPLLWWRPVWIDAQRLAHPMVASEVRETRCPDGGSGVERVGTVDGVALRSVVCVDGDARFRMTTTATGLAAGAVLADEINPGTADVTVEDRDARWEGIAPTRVVTVTERGVQLRFEGSESTDAARNFVHIAGEAFPAAVTWEGRGAELVRTLEVTAPAPKPEVSTNSARLTVAAVAEGGAALPVHVMFVRAGVASVQPELLSGGRGFASDRSVYLLDGTGEVALQPGTYVVTVSHGLGWTLHSQAVTLGPRGSAVLRAVLHAVADPGWIPADLHLHSAPSPDSRVTLEERVVSLVCNGIGFAVATDHNRITDLAPVVRTMGLEERLTTLPGDEVTSAGAQLWGHFNAFPLPVPAATTAPEDAVPAYWGVAPAELFAATRRAGAGIVQVNHPRMAPNLGYFDLAALDAATGRAGASFADGFDAVETYNGLWLESPDRVREAVTDLVGLGRRGMRVTATGNSDSHRLVYEEAGYPRTWIRVPDGDPAALRERVITALRRGDTTVSSGPFVTLDTLSDGRDGRLRVHVRVTAPEWVPVQRVELWRDDTVVQRWTVTAPPRDGLRFEADAVIPLAPAAMVLAWADADAPLPDVVPLAAARAVGFTSPRYIDRDGDGRVIVPPRR